VLCFDKLNADLESAGLAEFGSVIISRVREDLRKSTHGKLAEWLSILQELPDIPVNCVDIGSSAVRAIAGSTDNETQAVLRELLLKLIPWRKGPFDICGVSIDSEWQSDRKWARVLQHISPLRDRLVLDVGCGNGYYALRMSGQGTRLVLGLEPTLQYVVQFQAVQHYVRQPMVHVLPMRLADMPARCQSFDTTFSMGVLYHQRNPLEHLRQLRGTLRDGGELLLETLVLPGDRLDAKTPDDRYARMRNVWHLPTLPLLQKWLEDAGFDAPRIADTSVTTTDEQRRTEWMPFESLQQALDPLNPQLTVEGLPRPCRVALVSHVST
jgi:tRNA (mo5U34)-methyltransferase